jgi:RpiB/LacA/LacB family sugar-phosphate isomerase
MKIKALYLGTDHGGFAIKAILRPWLEELAGQAGGEVRDFGAKRLKPDDDYPEFAQPVARRVNQAAEAVDHDPTVWGVLLCRSGAGMAIVANRFPHNRAVVCRSVEDARHAREHNNANIVVLEGDYVTDAEAKAIVQTFFGTKFGGGRHARRLRQIAAIGEEISA